MEPEGAALVEVGRGSLTRATRGDRMLAELFSESGSGTLISA